MPKYLICSTAKFGLAGLILFACSTVNAQSLYQPNPAEVKARVKEVLRRFQLYSKATAQEVEQLAALQIQAETPGIEFRNRATTYLDLYKLLYRLNGVSNPPQHLLNVNAQMNAGVLGFFVSSGPVKPLGKTTLPWGQLGHVEKRGRGPLAMILIAPPGTDWTIYRTFMERNADRYTMFAITLPGSGNTPLPVYPKFHDQAATPWWNSAQQGILGLIEKHKLTKPVIAGMQATAYLAARLALDNPDKIRAAVMIGGLARMPQASETDPDRQMTLVERRQSVSLCVLAMATDLYPPVTLATREGGEKLFQSFLKFFSPGMSRNPERNKELFLMGAVDSSLQAMRYTNELITTDLTNEFSGLTVPVLAITCDHDDGSVMQGSPDAAQWTEVKLRYPSIPLTISRFENSRVFATEDAPEDLDTAIAAFVAGNSIEINRAPAIAIRPSPRASVEQQIGLTNVLVRYGRPQTKSREIWGKLVPWNHVWRAGANEATTITFNRDVFIEGQKLAAGTYSFFVIPSETEWTAVFNRVSHQWGAFNYNAEFDALRVKTKPQTIDPMEWLTFSFELTGQQTALLVLRWEKMKLSLKIEDIL